jgi:hypothetical protein
VSKEEDERLYEQTVRVHRAISERTGKLWEDLPLIDEVEFDAAMLGTMTALIHEALFRRSLWYAIGESRGTGHYPDDDREDFLELAGDCWDDANHEDEEVT